MASHNNESRLLLFTFMSRVTPPLKATEGAAYTGSEIMLDRVFCESQISDSLPSDAHVIIHKDYP